jgi:hypothetical protein
LAAKTQITAETLIQQAQTLYDRALESGQLGAGVSAVKETGILTGHRIERKEVGSPGEFDSMTDDELERVLVERMEQLGYRIITETTLGLTPDGERTPDAGSDRRH